MGVYFHISRGAHSLTLPDGPAADISTVIVDQPQKAVLLLEHVERKETPGLTLIILMEHFEEALRDRGQECGVAITSMQAVEVRGCLRATTGPLQARAVGQLPSHTLGGCLRPQGMSVLRWGRLPKGCWWVGVLPLGNRLAGLAQLMARLPLSC